MRQTSALIASVTAPGQNWAMPDSLQNASQAISDFAESRDWDQFHSVRNLILALVGEVGELAEVLQWKNDSDAAKYLQSQDGKDKITEEVADVAIYLIRICQKLNVDLVQLIAKKIEINESKYPVSLSKGNAKKYTEFDQR